MLYPTLNQPLIVLWLLLAGFFGGLIFDLFRFVAMLSGNDKYSKYIFDFFATICVFGLLVLVNLKLNYGQFRLYVPFVFMITFTFERIIIKILWTKLLQKWYSNIAQRRKSVKSRKKEEND